MSESRGTPAEIEHHLDQTAERAAGKHPDGFSQNTMLTDLGESLLAIPRDRQGQFNPKLI